MLSEAQGRYIRTIPEEKITHIEPFNEADRDIAEAVIEQIKHLAPNLEVRLLGSTGLGIAGQRDLDIYALVDSAKFTNFLPVLVQLFGEPTHQHSENVEWLIRRKGREIELYLTDPTSSSMKEQLDTFELLASDEHLRKEYEDIKLRASGKSAREYQAAKYEFFNRILEG